MLHSHPVNPGGKPPPAPVFVFECAACCCVQVSGSPRLPVGWTTETIGETTFAYCPDDSGDLPRTATGERGAGSVIRRPNPLTHSLSKGTHHELQRVQQEMDDEAATLRLRNLRGGYIPDPSAGSLIAGALIGAALGLAWLLFCLWVQSC